MTITCAVCGAQTPGEDSYFSDAGEVCAQCNSKQEIVDRETFAANAHGNTSMEDASSFSTTTSSGTTIEFTGALGILINLFRMLFGRR